MGHSSQAIFDKRRWDGIPAGLVHFENAVVVSSTARDLMTLRSADEGLILNFADNPVGPGRYEAVVAFPPGDSKPNASITVVSSLSLALQTVPSIEANTVAGVWYKLQSANTLTKNDWISTGSFVRGNGGKMKLFDPSAQSSTRYYRVVSKISPLMSVGSKTNMFSISTSQLVDIFGKDGNAQNLVNMDLLPVNYPSERPPYQIA